MTSLSTHLRDPEAHRALPFHAECPICRSERLVGSLASGGPVSPRAQAAVAASVLAFGTTAPAALAAEQESEHEGSAPVTQTSTTDPSQNPSFDPGGNSEALPAQAPEPAQNTAPATAGNDDNGPIEQQPATNTNEPVVDNGDGQSAGQPQTQPTPQSPPTPEAPPPATNAGAAGQPTSDSSAPPSTPPNPAPPADAAAPTTAPAEPATAEADEAPAAGPARSAPRAQGSRPRSSDPTAHSAVRHRHTSDGGTVAPPTPAPAPPSTPGPGAASTTTAADHAKPGDRSHRVHAGESLWSIASDMLGPNASPARIAREVHRLWQLNHERIGTGRPDLLMIGTTLRLQ